MNQQLLLAPRKALNKAFLKVKPNRSQIESFKINLIELMDGINENESEEFHKNLVSHFLKNTYYLDQFFINTKEREDLAIYNGKDGKSPVGVIIEAKKPSNKGEMLSKDNLNKKALHELILYYLRERITGKNLEVKQLVVTNIFEWFIFDAAVFEKFFAKNKTLVHQFTEFEEKRLSGTTTDLFYSEIAAPEVAKVADQLTYTYFDLREIEKIARSNQKDKDTKLVPFYKIFSPEHLLKLSFKNDSNSLNSQFYKELLHIIGLDEIKEKSKKLIGRKAEGKRDAGSLLENAITILQYEDHLSNVKRSEYGSTKDEQLYHVALELVITWINRVLFLKLLEGQLVQYHQGSEAFRFLSAKFIPNYDELNRLFFQVLAVKEEERNERVQQKYAHVPYLNSSLFETNLLERKTIRISNLEDDFTLPLLSNTILKDRTGKRTIGKKNALHYLFEFLDAYDFASEGSEDIQEESKMMINASVLGLIFEKINGYKDGSFFTPGFITMYMSRETIRRAVVQKFNDAWSWHCQNFDELQEDLANEIRTNEMGRDEVRSEANKLINSMRICDPAVGSGHFLVSALNELIAIKATLNVLIDCEGKSMNSYSVEIANDELIVTNLDGELFEYHLGNKESQRVQETFFHEKQTLIENCLFGVDINPNSVKICRLRLWIELLKNAYYRDEIHLETLPNIDINIKCGNSLISRYSLDADIKKALKKSKWTIDSYRLAVQTYREASNKEEKHNMQRLIDSIKNDFESEIAANDKRVLRLNKLKGELFGLTNQQGLFEMSKTQQRSYNKKVKDLAIKVKKLETELEEIKNNQIYDNAFEWRFEFPEVLNDEGDFIGFDVVIGNPPYAVLEKERNMLLEPYANILEYCRLSMRYKDIEGGKLNLYRLFISLAFQISKSKSEFAFITPLTLLGDSSLYSTRLSLLENSNEIKFDCFPQKDNPKKRVFEDAKQSTLITIAKLREQESDCKLSVCVYPFNSFSDEYKSYNTSINGLMSFDSKGLSIPLVNENEWDILKKMHTNGTLGDEENIIVRRGEINQTIFRKYINKEFDNATLIKGVEVAKFKINESLSQGTKEYFDEEKYTVDGKINYLVDIPRIVMQRITGVDEKNRIVATIAPVHSYFADSTNSVHLVSENEFSLYFLLGLLNSKLFQWRFKKTSSNNNVGTNEIEALPFTSSFKLSGLISDIVIKILSIKSQSPDIDTTALEVEIDLLVYKLYGLTWEEVRIVDPEFELSEEAYENYTIE